jgi:hypothetical protein
MEINDKNKKMVGAAAVVLFLITGAWMMGRKSSAPANGLATGYAQPSQPGMMNPGAGPQGAMPPQGAQFGANPGADMSQQGAPPPQINGGQMGPAQTAPSSDMNPGGGQAGPGADPSQQYQPPMNGGGAGGGAQQYQDPNGQFTIRVPSGWQSTPQNGGVVITRGGSMVMVSPFEGAQSSEQIVSTIARQYGSQWQNLQVSDQGRFQIN